MSDNQATCNEWSPSIDPVLCSPYQVPDLHWKLDNTGRATDGPPLRGRRDPVMSRVPKDTKGTYDQQLSLEDDGRQVFKDRWSNPLVASIRRKVSAWRNDGYPGVTATTRRLLHHWTDDQAMTLRPFFAQVEAVETLIWLREVVTRRTRERQQLEELARRHNDGLVRYCAKMATGTGKTAVMGMAIAWQTLNAARSTRTRNVMFTNRFVVFAPGHIVRERLAVLQPSDPNDVYEEMGIVPRDLRRRLNTAKVRIVNFQAFTQKELIADAKARGLLGKDRGEDIESWEAAVRRVLGDLIGPPGICVINDEAHHCYLPPARKKSNAQQKKEDGRASVWFNAIRALRDMGALGKVDIRSGQAHPVLDFSATPLWINTASKAEPEQFEWVASDFGLMDAIESGLVKVPRLPIDDDSTGDETAWRKLYDNTAPKNLAAYRDNPNTVGLPDQLNSAVDAVISDWKRTLTIWEEGGQPTPPVLILVANSIQNAVALYRHLAGWQAADGTLYPGAVPELSNVDEYGRWYPQPRTLVVHSKVADDDSIPNDLKNLLVKTSGTATKKEAEEAVRGMLNTVGKTGEAGAHVRCVVSVSMLTEGWDARTVTHIVGFRAFSTQLLCEQVTGRALRRTSYDAFRDGEPNEESRQRFGDDRRRLEAEYAEVVGIPFEFMPGAGAGTPGTPKPRTRVRSLPDRKSLRVVWPQVLEYAHVAGTRNFHLDRAKATGSLLEPVDGKPTMALLAGITGDINIIGVGQDDRRRSTLARLAGEMVRRIEDGESANGVADARGKGRITLFRSAFAAARQWSAIQPLGDDDWAYLAAGGVYLQKAADHILEACDLGEATGPSRRARLDRPMLSDTAGIDFETTLSHIRQTTRSELSHAACHSLLELRTAAELDAHPQVVRWVRNFQLGWTIPYLDEQGWRRYEPDFVAVVGGGVNLIVECKGVWDTKAEAAENWTRKHWIPCVAGTAELADDLRAWRYGVIDNPSEVKHQLGQLIQEATSMNRRVVAAV